MKSRKQVRILIPKLIESYEVLDCLRYYDCKSVDASVLCCSYKGKISDDNVITVVGTVENGCVVDSDDWYVCKRDISCDFGCEKICIDFIQENVITKVKEEFYKSVGAVRCIESGCTELVLHCSNEMVAESLRLSYCIGKHFGGIILAEFESSENNLKRIADFTSFGDDKSKFTYGGMEMKGFIECTSVGAYNNAVLLNISNITGIVKSNDDSTIIYTNAGDDDCFNVKESYQMVKDKIADALR